jgi:hypothetical protein
MPGLGHHRAAGASGASHWIILAVGPGAGVHRPPHPAPSLLPYRALISARPPSIETSAPVIQPAFSPSR